MNDSCIVCGGTGFGDLYGGMLIRCTGCGHVKANIKLNDDDLAMLYKKDYFHGKEYKDYLADSDIIKRNFTLRLKILRPLITPKPDNRLLEIGSAYGLFLDMVRAEFGEVEGVDISGDCVRFARESLGLNVACSDFLKYDMGARKYDVICMWDSIEHLMRPDLCLDKIRDHTEKGAILAITTGDIESVNAKMRKYRWRLIHPPTHIHYFSRHSLKTLLDAKGFDIAYDRYCGFERSLDLAFHRLFAMKTGRQWLYNILKRTRIANLSFYVNLHDIMYVVARKR